MLINIYLFCLLLFLFLTELRERRASSPGPSTEVLNQAPKRPRLAPSDHLSDVEDSSDDTESDEDEVSGYIQLKPPKGDSFDVLLWWKEHQEDFPNLSTIARGCLRNPRFQRCQ